MSKNIKIQHKYGYKNQIATIEEYVKSKLYDHDTQGSSEQALSNAEKAQIGLSTLCQILTDKGLLQGVDIIAITDSWDDDIELVEIIEATEKVN